MEEALPEFRALVARVIAGESMTGIRLHRRHRDGTPLEISLSTAPTRDASGVIDGVMSIIEEVSDRVRAEAEIQALNTTLEQRVAERTASLEAALGELESFTNTVAHDLKAPLRGIDGYSRLLREEVADRLTGDDRDLLDRIIGNAEQMQRLIDDLLAYARLERRAPRLRAVDLTPAVAAVRQQLQGEIDRCGAEITLTLPPLMVHADADDLTMVLQQLLDNALKFSCAATPPRIEIGGRTEAQRGILWIRDNGIGFDPRYHDRIFGIFERLERAEAYPGTGIGLALVHKALQRMDGRVWAESAPGAGAVFYVELPSAPDTAS
jgi:signal transduction histidine kinase